MYKFLIATCLVLPLGLLSSCFDFLKEDEEILEISLAYDGDYAGIASQSGIQIGIWEMSIADGLAFGYYYDGSEWIAFNGVIYADGKLKFGMTLSNGVLVDVTLVIDDNLNVSGKWSDSDDEKGTIEGSVDYNSGNGGQGGSTSNVCVFSSSTGTVDGELGDSGEMTTECTYTLGDLTVTSLTLRYELGIFFGEVTRKAVFKWEGLGSISGVLWGAAVINENGEHLTLDGNPLYMSWEEGTFEGPGEGFGWDVTGSPSWSDVFLLLDKSKGEFYQGVDAEMAKAIYKADFTLSDLIILNINGEKL
ncbi:hypothetical protein N6H18_02995 [Reichenbachiella agarivorans]|uniref:Uncharacterized protein n=1 Tax=Reichenbachiella agarivorans TaxID=2979464 RepID=A0ABY6CQX3_9BACT|nr:hypothetical protein [Reichenbachiella agarivorans]UXP32921.1 hypothetical protein N6H18_02995 [Reichenbachiella agarivorans]